MCPSTCRCRCSPHPCCWCCSACHTRCRPRCRSLLRRCPSFRLCSRYHCCSMRRPCPTCRQCLHPSCQWYPPQLYLSSRQCLPSCYSNLTTCCPLPNSCSFLCC